MKSSRVLYFDVLNVISCVSVVCMHSNGYFHSYVKDGWWWLRVLVEVICYFAVPVFFMLSGATLLGYREKYPTLVFYKKRLRKTFFPYLVWSVIFYSLFILNNDISTFPWREVLNNFINGTIPYTNYWFFIPLFLLYLFIPFLSLIVISISDRLFILLCVLLLLLQFVFPMICSLIDLDFETSLPIGGYVIYVLLGYLFAKKDYEKNSKYITIIGSLALVALIIRYIVLYSASEKIPICFSYFGLYAVFPAMFVFLLIKRLVVINGWGRSSMWSCLSKMSFGVYLIHTFFIILLSKVIPRESPCFLPISIVLVYTLSFLSVMFLQKNKFTRYLVP